nr:AKR_HP1_G0018170.mRNA.1.CDS.1 [Saccharomyces cerevisiae]
MFGLNKASSTPDGSLVGPRSGQRPRTTGIANRLTGLVLEQKPAQEHRIPIKYHWRTSRIYGRIRCIIWSAATTISDKCIWGEAPRRAFGGIFLFIIWVTSIFLYWHKCAPWRFPGSSNQQEQRLCLVHQITTTITIIKQHQCVGRGGGWSTPATTTTTTPQTGPRASPTHPPPPPPPTPSALPPPKPQQKEQQNQ